jgi:predicted RNA-binding Zn-ribbon protein involved in translation (DUF1610 family)
MEQKELEIDVAAVAQETVQDRQPGEDLDEALLRNCKKLYGESGTIALQAIQSAVTALAGRTKIDYETALKQIAAGQSSVRVTARIQTTRNVTTSSLQDLSPEMRAQVEKALAEGKNQTVFITKNVSAHNQKQTAMNRCDSCGFEFPSEISTCPQCGKAINRSFWSRLFGK